MSSDQQVITKDKSFYSKRVISSVALYKECFDKYSLGAKKSYKLQSDLPIFVDTSVLLRYYEISFTARQKLLDFIKKNHKQIVITSQVQYEFLKNREDNIYDFFEQITQQLSKDFDAEILNKIENFSKSNKEILTDYPFLIPELNAKKNELKKLKEQLEHEIKQNKRNPIELVTNDEYLAVITSCILQQELNDEELKLTKDDFDKLKQQTSPDKVQKFIEKSSNAFPGAADIQKKPDNPYGDFIVFHEIMKYMEINKTDTIFLTSDRKKGDWMSDSGSPHLHYIMNMYANTGQIIYILDAERTLENILKVNIDSLVNSSKSPIPLNILPKPIKEYSWRNKSAYPNLNLIVEGTYKDSFLLISDIRLSVLIKHVYKIVTDYSTDGYLYVLISVQPQILYINFNFDQSVGSDGSVLAKSREYMKITRIMERYGGVKLSIKSELMEMSLYFNDPYFKTD